MLQKTLASLIVAGLTCAGGSMLGAKPASAMPFSHEVPKTSTADTSVQPVRWVYVSGRHGHRYRVRRGGYNYYYGGYWYARPWWGVSVGPVVVYSSRVHGPRYRYRRAGYGYYYRGYWYHRRWW